MAEKWAGGCWRPEGHGGCAPAHTRAPAHTPAPAARPLQPLYDPAPAHHDFHGHWAHKGAGDGLAVQALPAALQGANAGAPAAAGGRAHGEAGRQRVEEGRAAWLPSRRLPSLTPDQQGQSTAGRALGRPPTSAPRPAAAGPPAAGAAGGWEPSSPRQPAPPPGRGLLRLFVGPAARRRVSRRAARIGKSGISATFGVHQEARRARPEYGAPYFSDVKPLVEVAQAITTSKSINTGVLRVCRDHW